MKKNLGTIDKIVRVFIAVVVALLYFTGILSGTVGIVLMIAGIILVLTSVVSFCPIYFPFGISTAKKK